MSWFLVAGIIVLGASVPRAAMPAPNTGEYANSRLIAVDYWQE